MMKDWAEPKRVDTFYAEALLACDYDTAVKTCREYSFNVGLCVTVTKTRYVYTCGAEDGVIVKLINYPRFPKSPSEIKETAIDLGFHLAKKGFQGSFSIQTPTETLWYSRRGD